MASEATERNRRIVKRVLLRREPVDAGGSEPIGEMHRLPR